MFDLLFIHLLLKFRSSRLKLPQSLLQLGHFLFDFAKFYLVLGARQTISPELLSDVPLKLTPQQPQIRISPDRSFSIFKFANAYAFDNEVPADSVFFLRRHVAQGCPFAIPLTVFCHFLSL